MTQTINYGSITTKAGNITPGAGQLWISTSTGSPTGGPFNLADVAVSEDGYMYINNVAGSPGSWQQVGTGILVGAVNITSNSSTAFTVGPNGTTNPAFRIDASAASLAAGIRITGGADTGTVVLATIAPTNAALNINAVGNVPITLGNSGTSSVIVQTPLTVQSASSVSVATGPNGATNPVWQIDSSTASQAAGLKLTGAVTGGTVALAAIDSGSNTNLTIDGKGSGTIGIGTVSTGAITLGHATTITTGGLAISGGNLTFGGTGQLITGDFSNATIANRVLVQTSTANSGTTFGLLPSATSGSNSFSIFTAYGGGDATNNSFTTLTNNGVSAAVINSGHTGTGTTQPLNFRIDNTTYVTIPTTGGLQVTAGNVGIGAAPISNVGINVGAGYTIPSSAGQTFSASFAGTSDSSTITLAQGVTAEIRTAAAAFTLPSAYTYYASNAFKGAGSSITSLYGLYVEPMTAGATTNYGIYINAPSGGSGANVALSLTSSSPNTSSHALLIATTATITAASGVIDSISNTHTVTAATGSSSSTGAYGYYGYVNPTVNSTVTLGRAAAMFLDGITGTINGTLTNHNVLYLGTPVNGTTVRVIDTSSGAFLTTGGTWTNNPSWAHLKEAIRPATEVDDWMKFMAKDHNPVWYRYQTRKDEEGKILVQDQEYEHDHFGFLLDDIKAGSESLFKAITNDETGSISTKDSEGVLFAMVANLAKRITELETKINGSL